MDRFPEDSYYVALPHLLENGKTRPYSRGDGFAWSAGSMQRGFGCNTEHV